MNDDEMNYIQACLEFAAQLGQIADDTLEAVERRRILENEKRKELLEKLSIPVEVIPSGVDEELAVENSPYERVSELSKLKASAVAKNIDDEAVIIGADTR